MDAIANLGVPRSGAVDVLWNRLNGYWTATDNVFVGFTYIGGSPSITFGYIRSGWLFIGRFVSAAPTGDYGATLTFWIPPEKGDELTDAREEMLVDVYLDASSLPAGRGLRLMIAMQGSGGWYSYTWRGNSVEDTW
jgi:hypothetical protein